MSSNRKDLPLHERSISAAALESLDRGIADAKAGRIVSAPSSLFDGRPVSQVAPPATCHCGKGCRVILKKGTRIPTTKCYLDYLHKVWKLKR